MSQPAVLVQQLGFTFAGRDTPSLAEISFSLEPGSWTVVTGRTGSGKTTLLRALAGLIPRHTSGRMQGRVVLFGDDTGDARFWESPGRVGLVQQSPDDQICTTSVMAEMAFGLENLAMPPEEIGRRIEAGLQQVDLVEMADARVRELSGGQKQRLILASVLAMQPGLLLLDEPLSQLDPQAAADLLDTLKRLRDDRMTIVIVEHRLDEILPLADRVLVLDRGQLVANDRADDSLALETSFTAHGLQLPDILWLANRLGKKEVRTAAELVAAVPAAKNPTPKTTQQRSRDNSNRVPLLSTEELAYSYPGMRQPVWSDISLRIGQYERVALVGPNGSGKSTLLAVLAGLLRPTAGGIRLAPDDDSRGRCCGLVLQNPDLTLFCRTVHDELAFGPRQLGRTGEEIDRWSVQAAGAMSIESLWDQSPQALSQGERLRTAVAATLAMHPRLLLLDEPTTGQDLRQVHAVMDAVEQQIDIQDTTGAVLFSTHDLRAVVRHADRVLVLAEGGLAADCTPEELLADERLLRLARLRRPPLYEARHRWQLAALTADEMLEELLS